MFPELIETDRLRLERHDIAVTPRQFYAASGDGQTETIAEETEHVSWTPHDHLKESYEIQSQFAEQWGERDGATYAVIPKEDEDGGGRYAGNTGVAFDWDTRTATLGIWLRKPFWGRGYSGERAAALASLAFDRLDLEILAVDVMPDNEQSVRAIEKYVDRLGGHREGRFRNHVATEDGPADVYRFSVSQAEYENAVGDEDLAEFTDELDEPTLAGSSPAEATEVPERVAPE
ncbi:MAG: GNAT family N-acetyltransferase [Halobaculum sp.]